MPPKVKFTKEQITEAALELTREGGLSAVTARSIAKKLKSSPKVIFGLFENMEEVQRSVITAAKALYREYIERGLAEKQPFRGVGTQYILFSIQEPKLFQLLFMSEKQQIPSLSDILPLIDENYRKILLSIQEDTRVDKSSSERLYRHLWVYTHGIASLCATKMCRFTAEEISDMMADIYLGLLLKIKEESKNA